MDSLRVVSHLPTDKRVLLEALVDQLQRVSGVVAIVLGGSYASGTEHAASDLDVGIYYAEVDPFAIPAIRAIATAIANDGDPTVTDFYQWGAWVNGGAWIHTTAGKVDLLYRNLDQIQRTIADAQQGITHHDYGQQPAYGFYSVIYLAETAVCIPLWDPIERIAELKAQVVTYPAPLKAKLTADSLWSAEFSLIHARTFAAQGDIYNTTGCLTRIAANLTQTLFALNERYFMRDKQVMTTIATFATVPPGYVDDLTQILSAPGNTAAALTDSVDKLTQLWGNVAVLAGSLYEPKFDL